MNKKSGIQNRGSVIITVLLIMLVMASVTLTAFSMVLTNHMIFNNDVAYHQAYYLAEAGLNCACYDLVETVYEVHKEISDEYLWDPLKFPGKSIREGLYDYIFNYMGPRLRTRLMEKGILSNRYKNEAVFNELSDYGNIDVRVVLESRYNNPLKFTISSIGSSGNIQRRMEAVIHVYKVSLHYDSKLFDYAAVLGSRLSVENGGRLYIEGNTFAGEALVFGQSIFEAKGDYHSPGTLNIQNGGNVTIQGNTTVDSVVVTGGAPACFTSGGNLSLYNLMKIEGQGSKAHIKGPLYNTGRLEEKDLRTGGIICADGGSIVLEDDFFINACIKYQSDEALLFGLEDLSEPGMPFYSGESIGGGNESFYYFNKPSGFINKTFNRGYLNRSTDKKADVLVDYIKNIPKKESERQEHEEHLQKLDFEGISLKKHDLSYAIGAIFADGEPIIQRDKNIFRNKTQEGTPEAFFNAVESEMRRNTDWNITSQRDTGFQVPYINAAVVEGVLTPMESDMPLLVIEPDNVDIALPTGSYRGIIYTEGTVTVHKDEDVSFEGLVIAGGGLNVSGRLTLSGNKALLLGLIKNTGGDLANFFKLGREPDFIQVVSWHEKKSR